MRSPSRVVAGAAAIALAAGVVAGCGGGSSEPAASEAASTGAPALTKAEYVAEADAICAKIDATENAIGERDLETPAEAKAAIESGVLTAKAGLARLKALVPPAELQAAHEAFVQSSEDSVALFEDITTQIEAGGAGAGSELQDDITRATELEAKQRAAVRELGLSTCFTGDATDADDSGDADDNG